MTEQEKQDLRERWITADQVYATEAGKRFVHYLMEELKICEVVMTDAEIAVHNFGIDFFAKYFGVFLQHAGHKKAVAEAIMAAKRPSREDFINE